MKILFVCTGNTCRSALAEHLLRHEAAKAGLPMEVSSCGIAAERYFPIPVEVREELARRGVAEVKHTPQLVSRPLMSWAEAVLPMTEGHRQVLLELYPEHSKKIKIFLDFAGMGPADVEDPIGKPAEVYADCAKVIEEAIRSILSRHAHAA